MTVGLTVLQDLEWLASLSQQENLCDTKEGPSLSFKDLRLMELDLLMIISLFGNSESADGDLNCICRILLPLSYNLSHHPCCILLVGSRSQVPSTLKGTGHTRVRHGLTH